MSTITINELFPFVLDIFFSSLYTTKWDSRVNYTTLQYNYILRHTFHSKQHI